MSRDAPQPQVLPSQTRAYADGLIRRIVEECPRRVMGSESERRAQDILAEQYAALGYDPEFHEFRWNRSLYAVFVLHFGLAVLASGLFWVWPAVALVLHLLVAVSYYLDGTRRGFVLRRLFPTRASRNLYAVRPAARERALRIVLIGHADAAYTGVVFHPTLIRAATKEPPLKALRFMRKGLLVAVLATLVVAGIDVVAMVIGPKWWLGPFVGFFTLPAWLAFVFNLDVVVRNTIVPGANDNLTGCAAGVILADRLRDFRPDDIELVFVATGAEEAGTGGAYSMARDFAGRWDVRDTVIIAIDSMSNGDLRMLIDGEMFAERRARWLEEIIGSVAASEPRYDDFEPFEIPSGATDAMPFIRRGYDATAIGCVDPRIGAPRGYHHPSDDPDRLDLAQFELSVDFVEDIVRALCATRAAEV